MGNLCSNSVDAVSEAPAAPPVAPTFANRFKLSIRHIGEINVAESKVDMKFRVTLFWNDRTSITLPTLPAGNRNPTIERRRYTRFAATDTVVHVPQVKILNTSKLDIVDPAEVALLNEDEKLLRWTCEYVATVQLNLYITLYKQYDEARTLAHTTNASLYRKALASLTMDPLTHPIISCVISAAAAVRSSSPETRFCYVFIMAISSLAHQPYESRRATM
jgi:hypothetical protein